MATLAVDAPRRYVPFGSDLEEYPVIAADIIFEGAAVGDDGLGNARPLVAGDPFRGFAQRKADNGAGAAGDIRVEVRQKGAIRLSIAGLVAADLGKPVYASDDDTFTLTQGTNSHIGRVVRFESAGLGLVAFDATKGDLGLIGELTDSTTGTADGTVSDVGGTFNQATLNNNFAELTAKINALARQLA